MAFFYLFLLRAAAFLSALIFSSSDFSFLNFKFISKDLLSIYCEWESDEELRLSLRGIGSEGCSGLEMNVLVSAKLFK